jgi:hypothetical protein
MSENNQREKQSKRSQSKARATRKSVQNAQKISKDSSDPNAETFPSVPPTPPIKQDYIRMISFVSLYLAVVFVACVLIWVIEDSSKWKQRLLFCTTSIFEALLRVILGAWWLKAAGPRLALVFVEVDVLTLSVVGFFTLVLKSLTGAMQYNLVDSALTGEVLKTIFVGATIKESGKFVCYLVPLLLGQINSASHLLFTAAIAGALGILYADMLTSDTEYDAPKFVMGLLYTMMYTLWTSMGCTVLCQIKQKRWSIWFAPLILIIPIIFHSCYLMAIAGHAFGWGWAGISAGYWILSALVLRVLLGAVLPMNTLFGKETEQKQQALPDACATTDSTTVVTVV